MKKLLAVLCEPFAVICILLSFLNAANLLAVLSDFKIINQLALGIVTFIFGILSLSSNRERKREQIEEYARLQALSFLMWHKEQVWQYGHFNSIMERADIGKIYDQFLLHQYNLKHSKKQFHPQSARFN